MPFVPAIDPIVLERSVDQRVTLWNVSWSDYEAVLAMRGESSSPRIAYLNGMLELTSPSRDHESLKTMIARLLEVYTEELAIDLRGFGSWTLKKQEEERAIGARRVLFDRRPRRGSGPCRRGDLDRRRPGQARDLPPPGRS